jgi:hypothetical protein
MLRHLEHKTNLVALNFERIQNRRQFALEFNVDNGTNDLCMVE